MSTLYMWPIIWIHLLYLFCKIKMFNYFTYYTHQSLPRNWFLCTRLALTYIYYILLYIVIKYYSYNKYLCGYVIRYFARRYNIILRSSKVKILLVSEWMEPLYINIADECYLFCFYAGETVAQLQNDLLISTYYSYI